MSWAGAGSASESAAAPRNAERTRRSVRAAMLRSSGGRRERGLALARRALVHQPLQREGGDADHDQRAPAEVVIAEAVEHHAAHPRAEERADLMGEEHDAVERVEVREAKHPADDPGDERRDAQPQE